jgi:hypothetical protein
MEPTQYPPTQQPYYPSPYPSPYPQVAPHTSGMAIAGLVLSFFCGLLGLIFSIVALGQISKSHGQLTGSGLAYAGVIISILSTIIGVAISAGG